MAKDRETPQTDKGPADSGPGPRAEGEGTARGPGLGMPETTVSPWQDRVARFRFLLVGIPAVLAVAVIVAALVKRQAESREREAEAVYQEACEATGTPAEKLAKVEDVLGKLQGRDVLPSALLHVAKGYYDAACELPSTSPDRKKNLEKALTFYETFNRQFADHAYGPLGAEGEGLIKEERGDLDGAIEAFSKAQATYGTHWLAPKLFYDLGRCHYFRYLEKKRDEDLAEARNWLNRAKDFTALRTNPMMPARYASPFMWRRDVDLLLAATAKPGPGLPDGKAPPERKKAEEKPKDGPPKKADEKAPKPDEKKPEGGDKKAVAPDKPDEKKTDQPKKPDEAKE